MPRAGPAIGRNQRARRVSAASGPFLVRPKPAARRVLPDLLKPGLKVVFVGYNAGDESSRVGHYYAHGGNQFWSFLHLSGLTPERLVPEQDHRLLEFGIGVTDVVKRWSKSSSELKAGEFRRGRRVLLRKLQHCAPRVVAFNGKGIYERLTGQPARLGLARAPLAGARVFVLPSTSGRNGSLTRAAKLEYFRRMARWVRRYA